MPAEANPDDKEKKPLDTTEAGRQLSFIGQFIDKYYLRQPKSLQTITFVVFVILFAYGFISILNGKYVLKGNVLAERETGPPVYAAFYGIRWGTEDFASNSKGEYYVALGFAEYARAVVSGSHVIKILQLDPKDHNLQEVFSSTISINRMDGEFEDVRIPYKASVEPPPTTPGAINRGHPDAWSLVPSAWASDASSAPGMYQLLVQGARLASGATKADASLALLADNQTLELRDHNISDLEAGHIPLGRDQNLGLGSHLYFPVPGNSLPIQGHIHVSAPASGFFQFSNYAEDFPLPTLQTVGQSMTLTGSRGSTLLIRLVIAQPLKLYRELNWEQQKDAWEAEFLNQGIQVRWIDAPLGPVAESNALWTGPQVPFDVVQRLLRAALDQKIPLKKIEYRYSFRSSQSLTEMQLGSSAVCTNAAPIPAEALGKAISAPSDDEFQKAISPFACKPSSPTHGRQRHH